MRMAYQGLPDALSSDRRFAVRKSPVEQADGPNPDLGLDARVGGVKGGRIVVEEVHPDHDAEEARDFGHGPKIIRSWLVRPNDLRFSREGAAISFAWARAERSAAPWAAATACETAPLGAPWPRALPDRP